MNSFIFKRDFSFWSNSEKIMFCREQIGQRIEQLRNEVLLFKKIIDQEPFILNLIKDISSSKSNFNSRVKDAEEISIKVYEIFFVFECLIIFI